MQRFCMNGDELLTPEQVAIYRKMPGEKRLRLAEQLYWSARKLTAAGVRSRHPDWNQDQVTAEVRRIFLNART